MRIVVVTGSGRGIGAGTAFECARRGMGVVVTDNSHPDKAAEVIAAIAGIGGTAVALKLDAGNSRSFPAFREAVPAQLNAIRYRLPDENRWSNAHNIEVAGAHII
jgi:NAD(P)-dependent dehydrogenase (short-subunit alcohol dehydrogenase family)